MGVFRSATRRAGDAVTKLRLKSDGSIHNIFMVLGDFYGYGQDNRFCRVDEAEMLLDGMVTVQGNREAFEAPVFRGGFKTTDDQGAELGSYRNHLGEPYIPRGNVHAHRRAFDDSIRTEPPVPDAERAFRAGFEAGQDRANSSHDGVKAEDHCPDEDEAWAAYQERLSSAGDSPETDPRRAKG